MRYSAGLDMLGLSDVTRRQSPIRALVSFTLLWMKKRMDM